ncbi:MAG: polyphosphate polymerase domain-containing protein [Phycisphaerae bacterium]|nr:polyphosphate polymerase domain-containing protein [Phycisphaerae bacterium]
MTDSNAETLSETAADSAITAEAAVHAQVAAAEPLPAAAAPTPASPVTKPKGDTLMACRYELKYRIQETTARAIAAYIKPMIPLDKYAQLRPNGEYPITSLYLDSDQLTLAKETLEGKKNRFKLRVRGYSDKPDTPIFFEIKRRIERVILKSRARGMHHHVPMILAGHELPPQKFQTDMKALRQFQLYVKYLNARPMVLVRYMRQAFEGDGDCRVRVTFDRQLSYCVTEEPRVRLGGSGWMPIPLDFTILEIKFTARYPAWLSELVRAFDLKVSAMSKYCSSVQQSMLTGFGGPRNLQILQRFA